jgi:hypothetical protein
MKQAIIMGLYFDAICRRIYSTKTCDASEIFVEFLSLELQAGLLHLLPELVLLLPQHVRRQFESIKEIVTVQCLDPKRGILLW